MLVYLGLNIKSNQVVYKNYFLTILDSKILDFGCSKNLIPNENFELIDASQFVLEVDAFSIDQLRGKNIADFNVQNILTGKSYKLLNGKLL